MKISFQTPKKNLDKYHKYKYNKSENTQKASSFFCIPKNIFAYKSNAHHQLFTCQIHIHQLCQWQETEPFTLLERPLSKEYIHTFCVVNLYRFWYGKLKSQPNFPRADILSSIYFECLNLKLKWQYIQFNFLQKFNEALHFHKDKFRHFFLLNGKNSNIY